MSVPLPGQTHRQTMKPRAKPQPAENPFAYHGPLRTKNGGQPTESGYFYPTEAWFAESAPGLRNQVTERYSIRIVELADGRWCTEGVYYYHIDEGTDGDGRKCVFPDRSSAIRASAARLIRLARWSIHWGHLGINADVAALVINWARNLVATETGRTAPSNLVTVREPYKPTGLPILDYIATRERGMALA